MLCNFYLILYSIFIRLRTLSSCRLIVPSGVTLPFLWFVQTKMHSQGFCEHLCRFTGAQLTEHIPLKIKLLQIIPNVLDQRFSIVLAFCHMVKIPQYVDAQLGCCEGNSLACRMVAKSCHKNWINHTPECFHLISTSINQLATGRVEQKDARVWRHHCPELVENVDPGMLFKKGCYPVHQMGKHTMIDSMKDIGYDNRCLGDAFDIHADTF